MIEIYRKPYLLYFLGNFFLKNENSFKVFRTFTGL
jgi:hypothetical protein